MSTEKQINTNEVYKHLWSSLKEGLEERLSEKAIIDLKTRLIEATKDPEEIVDKQLYVTIAMLKELFMNMNAMENKALSPPENDEQ